MAKNIHTIYALISIGLLMSEKTHSTCNLSNIKKGINKHIPSNIPCVQSVTCDRATPNNTAKINEVIHVPLLMLSGISLFLFFILLYITTIRSTKKTNTTEAIKATNNKAVALPHRSPKKHGTRLKRRYANHRNIVDFNKLEISIFNSVHLCFTH